ncbi:MAG: 8-oxoguanine DNA glycosylase [Clostridia bacterium]|nr:8-oxoguanine DNA glycosylase [Clostridia bacterium]
MYNWKADEKGIQIKKLTHFDPVHTFECGQCFRWNRVATGKWSGVVKGRAVMAEWDGQDLMLHGALAEDFKSIWSPYLDLERDYGAIKETLAAQDPVLEEAIRYGEGMRLLKQDLGEMLISFLISQNNGIPRIRQIIENLSRNFGEPIKGSKGGFYAFPTLERLSELSLEELSVVRAGYRDKYISKASRQAVSGEVPLELLQGADTKQARNHLLRFFGVGEKVADCILLFSGTCYDVFPVDRWVKRVMAELYLGCEASYDELYAFALKKFGKLCGFAQQYLFYYAREKKIGL